MKKFIVEGKTLYPKGGKGKKWTDLELKQIESSYQDFKVNDSDGLFGKVKMLKSGSISIAFEYSYRWEGSQKWIACGSYPKHKITNIRKRRDEYKEFLKLGQNPKLAIDAKKIEQTQMQETIIQTKKDEELKNKTFNDLYNQYIDSGVTRKNNNQELERFFKKDVLPFIGTAKLSSLTEKDILNLFEKIHQRASEMKPRARTILKLHSELIQLFKWADKRPQWRQLLKNGNIAELVNPSKFISSNYDDIRDRILTDQEIIKLKECLDKELVDYNALHNKKNAMKPLNIKIQCAIWIALSTLCRVGELLQTKWEHVDLKNGTWHIPMENTKGTRGKNRDHTIYLSSFSIGIFKRLFELTGTTQWCFPSQNNLSRNVDLKSYSKTIMDRQTQFTERSSPSKQRRSDNTLVIGSEKWTFHDLRRTGASIMQSLGVSINTIDLCQNHEIRNKVQKAYLQYSYAKEQKEAWGKLGIKLEELLKIPL